MAFRDYYQLTKPGIIYGNAMTAAAGFFLASRQVIDWRLFIMMLVGLMLVIAAACTFNNVIDGNIDAVMERTKNRPIPSGRISKNNALILASILGIAGISVLIFGTNTLTSAITLVTFFMYVVVYGYAKRRSWYGTHVGALAGASPPIIGYTSVTHSLDETALLLFIVMCAWQMAHFFAIAVYRRQEYAAARIPIITVVKGVGRVRAEILLYITAFSLGVFALPLVHDISPWYPFIVGFSCALWLVVGITGIQTKDLHAWARHMFRLSLLVIVLLSIAISI